MSDCWGPTLGAVYHGGGRCTFRVWAPLAANVEVVLPDRPERLPMQPEGGGYFAVAADGIEPGTRYRFALHLGDTVVERPDPASRSQPDGVHGPSAVVDPAFAWADRDWKGVPLDRLVLYELHVGTYTPEGTFEAVVPHMRRLRDLGITAIELMPVAQFPGRWGWGYDGVDPFAVQASYGGPHGLRTLVDACHAHGLAVVLDVVYNHLGPDGNYLAEFGQYFTARHQTPWGRAVNMDGPGSDDVRRYWIENALHWVHEYHVDGLRLDAVHAIHDESAYPFLEELADAVREASQRLGRPVHVIAESDQNDPRLVRDRAGGGFGLDAHWSDDFHHTLHTLLTGEGHGYYADYGRFDQFAAAYRTAYAYAGQVSPCRGRRHGRPPAGLPGTKFVVCAQNHDQVGNRKCGERLAGLVGFEEQKLAAAAVILSPFLPLLFMGEEYGEPAPFQYFVDFDDPELREAVRKGRAAEFAMTGPEPTPDPAAEATFLRSKLRHELVKQAPHKTLFAYYRELLRVRRESPAWAAGGPPWEVTDRDGNRVLVACRAGVTVALNFGRQPVEAPAGGGRWVLDSADPRWGGPGHAAGVIAPSSAAVFVTQSVGSTRNS